MGKIPWKMALRGNSPKPDPHSSCPQCGRYFVGERCPNPECRYKRGDLDKRGEKCERRITPTGQARALLAKLIAALPPDKRAEYERRVKEQKH